MIKYFSEADGYVLFEKYCPHAAFVSRSSYDEWLENIYCYGVSDYERPTSLNEAKDVYVSLIKLGIRIDGKPWIPCNDLKNMLELVQPISYCLYKFAPEYYFPYLFLCRIFELNKIADAFSIELPKLPKRFDYKNRCLYYWNLCETMYSFKNQNGLNTEELCAFLYDFAPKCLEENKVEMPKSSQAWFIGGRLFPEDKALKTISQANKKAVMVVLFSAFIISLFGRRINCFSLWECTKRRLYFAVLLRQLRPIRIATWDSATSE